MSVAWAGTWSAGLPSFISDLSARSHSPGGIRSRCEASVKLNTQSTPSRTTVSHPAFASNFTAGLRRLGVRAMPPHAACRSRISRRYQSRSSNYPLLPEAAELLAPSFGDEASQFGVFMIGEIEERRLRAPLLSLKQ
jgi:hypothetical protein